MVKAEAFQRRLAGLRASFRAPLIDGLLVSHLPNIRYLTGFTGTKARLLVTEEAALLAVDARYRQQAKEEAPHCQILSEREEALRDAIVQAKLKRLGFESGYLSFYEHGRLEFLLPSSIKLVPSGGETEALRLIKDEGEIAALRMAARYSSESVEAVLTQLQPGIRECEIAARLEYAFRSRSGEAPSFSTLVAAGPRSAQIHAFPTRRTVDPGEPLLIDAGATFEGYHADLSRSLTLGYPKKRFKAVQQAVQEALDEVIQAIRPGLMIRELDEIARKVLRRHQLETAFPHGLGHGVGLEIHEAPWIDGEELGVLQAGMAIAVEPGVYFDGWGGIRQEETILVTEHGAEVLTQSLGQPRVSSMLLWE